jgi:hypothetical protein
LLPTSGRLGGSWRLAPDVDEDGRGLDGIAELGAVARMDMPGGRANAAASLPIIFLTDP